MKKVPAVTQVRVSLKDGVTVVDLKPGNTVTLAELRQIIKNNGFVAKEASVVARGAANGPRAFVVGGTNEQLTLSAPPQQSAEDWRFTVAAPIK